jgi:hypothetical protein
MAQKFKSEIQLEALNAATTDTDKILVSDGGIIKSRTGAEILSDIGGVSCVLGTTNQLPKFTGTNTIGDSIITENDNKIGVGVTSPNAKLDINGDVLIKKVNLSNQENLGVGVGTHVIATVPIATYTAAFFDFVIKNGSSVRAGTVYAVHDGTNVEYVETSTNDLGNTSDVELIVNIISGNIRLLATTLSNNWEIKTLVRAI